MNDSVALTQLRATRKVLEAQLSETREYKALKAVDRAIEALEGLPAASKPEVRVEAQAPHHGTNGAMGRSPPPYHELASKLIRTRGTPQTIQEIVNYIHAIRPFNDLKKARITVGSMLSKDRERFQSVQFNGQHAWIFTGQASPETEAAALPLEKTAASP